MTPGKTNSLSCRGITGFAAYTLFEVLLALGIIAVLLGVTVPLITSSWSPTPSESIVQEIEKSVQATHSKAVETGEARQCGNSRCPDNRVRPTPPSRGLPIPAPHESSRAGYRKRSLARQNS